MKQKTAAINAGIESSISGIRVAKAFANEDYEIEKFQRGNDLYRNSKMVFYKAMGVFQCGMEFSTCALNVIVIGLGGLFIARGEMDLGDLVAFTLFVNAFIQPIKKLVNFFEQYTTGMAGFERFVELMRVEPEIADREGAVELARERVRGDIEFRGVSFSYSKDLPVIRDANLAVGAGRMLALVGPSGGGKSTLCQLIPRFYEIDSGAILVDGIDIRDATLASLRESIGIVQQDVFLFADTIKENIRYGRPGASDEEIVLAARRADIHDFIQSAAGGIRHRGGRARRPPVGRAEAAHQHRLASSSRTPPILILDEATSALDTGTEIHIQRAFEELSRGRTCLVIAHRPVHDTRCRRDRLYRGRRDPRARRPRRAPGREGTLCGAL